MTDFTVLVAPSARADGTVGDDAEAVEVRWQEGVPRLSGEAAAYLEARWEAYVAEARARDKTLFNGPITTLLNAKRLETSDKSGEKTRIELVLGAADYKTFLVAHLRDRAWFQAHAPEVSAAALGNSVLLTSGDRALLGIRSAKVSAYAEHAHLIGGVLDLLTEEERRRSSAESLIGHLLKELWEEAGVTEWDLEAREGGVRGRWPRFLGVARDEVLAQPEAVWQWEVRGELEEIGGRLAVAEHGGYVVVGKDMPEQWWGRMTPVARHVWGLWARGKER